MNEAGVDRPSRKIEKRKKEPGGVQVKPGLFKLEMTYGDITSSNSILVKSDPRKAISEKAINDSYTTGKLLEKMTRSVSDAVRQLVESKNTANDLKKKLNKEDKEKYKEQIKSSKEIVKRIDSLIGLYIGKEDKRQGITRNPEINVLQRIRTANWYSGSRPNGITKTETTLIEHARNQLIETLTITNDFFKTDWNKYQNEMEKLELSPFKKVDILEVNN